MTNIRAKIIPKNEIKVTIGSQNKIKVLPVFGRVSFSDLVDLDQSNKNDKYVMMYDAQTKKIRFANPDEVLSASSTLENIQPGLPSDFINTLDIDLDNKIDLDAGEF